MSASTVRQCSSRKREDDRISNIAKTAILAYACRAAGVPVERHVLPAGGHGFSMGHPAAAWLGWYAAWQRTQGVLG